jgi:hypothetical protein
MAQNTQILLLAANSGLSLNVLQWASWLLRNSSSQSSVFHV